jgi:hypothetical protein
LSERSELVFRLQSCNLDTAGPIKLGHLDHRVRNQLLSVFYIISGEGRNNVLFAADAKGLVRTITQASASRRINASIRVRSMTLSFGVTYNG